MGRVYAGILGPLAFGVVVARNLVAGEGAEAALFAAPLALFAFAAIGYVIGWIADKTITEAIEAQFYAQLQAEESAQTATISGMNPESGTDRPA